MNNNSFLRDRISGNTSSLLIPNIADEAGIKEIALSMGGDIENVVSDIEATYGPRNIPLVGEKDRAIMPLSTKYEVENILNLYHELKIPHILPERIEYVKSDEKISLFSSGLQERMKDILQFQPEITKILPFIHSQEIDRLSKNLGLSVERNHTSCEIINNKFIAQSELRRRGVVVPEGRLVYNAQEAFAFFEELQQKGYEKVALKLLRAASGMGVFPVSSKEELETYFNGDKISFDEINQGILIDGWVKGKFISSPNIQFYVGKESKDDIFISCSEQILSTHGDSGDGVIHAGNISNNDILYDNPQLLHDMGLIREWVREVGGYGIIGADFVIVEDEETGYQKAYFMEINGRVNGSTPGAVLTNTLTGNHIFTSWGINNGVSIDGVKNGNDFILHLERNRLLYNPSKKTGIIPTNLSGIPTHNKAMVLAIGSTKADVEYLLSSLK